VLQDNASQLKAEKNPEIPNGVNNRHRTNLKDKIETGKDSFINQQNKMKYLPNKKKLTTCFARTTIGSVLLNDLR
jgi:hypothetical protein